MCLSLCLVEITILNIENLFVQASKYSYDLFHKSVYLPKWQTPCSRYWLEFSDDYRPKGVTEVALKFVVCTAFPPIQIHLPIASCKIMLHCRFTVSSCLFFKPVDKCWHLYCHYYNDKWQRLEEFRIFKFVFYQDDQDTMFCRNVEELLLLILFCSSSRMYLSLAVLL